MVMWQTDPPAEAQRSAIILIYGDSGVGKTLACIRMPAPVAWVAFEDNALDSVQERGYRPQFAYVRTYEAGLDAIHELRRESEKAIRGGKAPPVRTVVIDSITSTEDRISEELVSHGGKGVVQDTRPEVLSQGGYGVLGGRHRALRESVLAIPGVHRVFLALPKAKTEEGTVAQVLPSISGQQGARFAAYCNWAFYMEAFKAKGGVQRRFHTQHNGLIYAKDRLGILAPEEPADLAAIMTKGRYAAADDKYHLRSGGIGSREESDKDWEGLRNGQ